MFRMIVFALAMGRAALLPATASSDGLEEAQREYYNARYESAARLTQSPCATDVNGLAACELRTAALLFQIRALLGKEANKEKAWKQCVACPELLSTFKTALARGQTLARTRLLEHPTMTRRCSCWESWT